MFEVIDVRCQSPMIEMFKLPLGAVEPLFVVVAAIESALANAQLAGPRPIAALWPRALETAPKGQAFKADKRVRLADLAVAGVNRPLIRRPLRTTPLSTPPSTPQVARSTAWVVKSAPPA